MKSDAELCAAWRCGDADALGDLFWRYEQDLHRMARSFSRRAPAAWNEDDAFEACIFGLIVAAEKHGDKATGPFVNYVHGCARHEALHNAELWTRRGQSPTGYDSALAELLLDPASIERLDVRDDDEAEQLRQCRMQEVQVAINKLPELQRIVVTEFYLERVTMREIGVMCGRNEAWAYAKRKAALRRIRAIVSGAPEPRRGWGFAPRPHVKGAKRLSVAQQQAARPAPRIREAIRMDALRPDSVWRRERQASEAARKHGIEVLPSREALT